MKPASRAVFCALAGIVASVAVPNVGSSQAPTPADAARESIVYIYFQVTDPKNGANALVQGTGFIVSKNGYVLTASHLFRKWLLQRDVDLAKNLIRASRRDLPDLVSESPLRLEPVNLGNPDAEDVALLKLPDSGRDYPVASVCDMAPSGNFVAYGFPENHPFQPVPGAFGTANAPGGRWFAAAAFTYGMSGGPVYAMNGVVGLVKGGLADTDAVRWITPIRFAAPLLSIAGVTLVDCKHPQPPQIMEWSLDNCREEANKAQRQLETDPSVILGVPKLIECKNPLGYKLRGNEEFYRTDYRNAERDFEHAIKHLPPQAGDTKLLWQSDLADTYLENGKIPEAKALYQQVFEVSQADFARFGVGRGFLYDGRDNSAAYNQAISFLRGVDPYYGGQTDRGIAQITLAAAEAGRIISGVIPQSQMTAASEEAKKELCEGIKKSEDFWRAVLRGTRPLIHYSFAEEKRLAATLGGATIACSN